MASQFNFKLLRRGAIYRINYTAFKTVPAPISFILYPGTLKVHAMCLNDPRMSLSEQMIFARFIKKMKSIPGVENYTGRMLYRIVKLYYPNIVRKSYRTYFTAKINNHSLLSYGIVPDTVFTDAEFSISNKNLYTDASRKLLTKILSTFTGTVIEKDKIGNRPKPAFYTPKPPEQPAETKQPETPAADTKIENEELPGYE